MDDFPGIVYVNLTGLRNDWYNLSKRILILNPDEEAFVILNITVPKSLDAVGVHRFIVSANNNSTSAELRIIAEPIIYDLSPPNGVKLGSNDIIFYWKTSVKSSSELYIKAEGESNYKRYVKRQPVEYFQMVELFKRK